VTASAGWLERRTARAPAALRDRVLELAGPEPEAAARPAALAAAGRDALERVVLHPGDRSVALDLLSADALITLALLAQAEGAPAELGAFAGAVLQAVRPGA
jgi:hypothetical protein